MRTDAAAIACALLLACCAQTPPLNDGGAGQEDAGSAGAGTPVDAGPDPADAGTPDGGGYDAGPGIPLPPLPLRTQGRWIVDANGRRFKLVSVNWYGAEEKDYVVAGLELADRRRIARMIRELGFNSVRLPWSNEMYELDPVVGSAVLAANPDLVGNTALQILDAVISALAHEGLLVILDNHSSSADWCCSDNDGNGLWYTPSYPEAAWILDWRGIVARYRNEPAVVGADLRNEPRAVLDPGCTSCTSCPCSSCACRTPVWGGLDPTLDWGAAARRGGNEVLGVNPDLLIFVEGINYSTDFSGPYDNPVTLSVANRLVYSPHDYSWFHPGVTTPSQLHTELGNDWGFLLVQDKAWTAPVWVGEFGTCNWAETCVDDGAGQGFWFSAFRAYLAASDIDWAYWAVNGTQARGTGRTLGDPETFGVLDPTWLSPSRASLMDALRALQQATQGP